jgi:lysophospholipase L1-like esterase
MRSLTNYGCNTESSVTMIESWGRFADILHNHYDGPQLKAAVAFLHEHAGQVSPITLAMGANDVIPDIDPNTCTVSTQWTGHLTTLDNNLRDTILPELVNALTDAQGKRTGDLAMTNLFNPYAKRCPESSVYIRQLNTVIAANAARFNIPVVDTYDAFGGENMAATICQNTWICSRYSNIHPQSAGYQIMANAIAAKTDY